MPHRTAPQQEGGGAAVRPPVRLRWRSIAPYESILLQLAFAGERVDLGCEDLGIDLHWPSLHSGPKPPCLREPLNSNVSAQKRRKRLGAAP